MGEKVVVIAVSETDSTMLPLDSEDRKFEMFPPGHDATSIIPSAIIGVMSGLNASTIANVIAGSDSHCSSSPIAMGLGFLMFSFMVRGLMPSATPNITKARMMFTIAIPLSPKFIVTELSDSSCSFMVYRFYVPQNYNKKFDYGRKLVKNDNYCVKSVIFVLILGVNGSVCRACRLVIGV